MTFSEPEPTTAVLPPARRALKRLARLALAVFYRRVDVVGVPPRPDRPAILAINHTNGLADAVVVLARTPAFPRFLAAASWWKFAPARWLFDLAGVLPVHRRHEGEDPSLNPSSFAACEEALAAGAQIAIHPEGEMHAATTLLPLRTGAARIALGAAADPRLRDLVVIPCGVVYEHRGRFRSDAALNVGEPIPVTRWIDEYRDRPEPTVRAFTEAIADGLRSVTANHETSHGASVIEDAAAFTLLDAEPQAPASTGYGVRHQLVRRITAAVDADGGESGGSFRRLEAAVLQHRDDLDALGGVRPDRSPSLVPVDRARRAQQARELAALTPVAATGAVLNAPVIVGLAAVGHFVRGESWQATTKGALGVVLCPVVWSIEAVALARSSRRPGVVAATVAVVAPLGGWALLAWHDRWRDLRESAWSDRVAERAPTALDTARASRARVRAVVASLGDVSAVDSEPVRSAVAAGSERA